MRAQRIFISSMPRSGSMWTFNATRQLVRKAGKTVKPAEPPPDQRPLLQEAAAAPLAGNEVWCVKTHNPLRLDIPGTLVIATYRDVRDSLASYMRFTRCNFDTALKAAQAWMKITDDYASADSDRLLIIRYDSITTRPSETVNAINAFIGSEVDSGAINTIAEDLKPENLKKRIGSLADSAAGKPATPATDTLELKFKDGTTRAYDKSTGFQAGHIGSINGGLWKEILDENEQAALRDATSAWLQRYEFTA